MAGTIRDNERILYFIKTESSAVEALVTIWSGCSDGLDESKQLQPCWNYLLV